MTTVATVVVRHDEDPTHHARRGRTRRLGRRVATTGGPATFVVALAALTVLPVGAVVARALLNGAAGLQAAVDHPDFPDAVRNTAALAVGSAAVATVLGTVLALAVTRLPARGRRVLRVVPLMPLVVPGVAVVTGWTFLLSPTAGYLNSLIRVLPPWNGLSSGPIDVYTVPWIVLLTGLSLTSFVYLYVSTALDGIDGDMDSAARAAGAGSVMAFLFVKLPLLRPAIVNGAGVAMLLALGQFTAPLLLGRNRGVDVLTTLMFRVTQDAPIDFALGAGFGLPVLVLGAVVLIVQRRLLRNQVRFVVSRTQRAAVGRPSKLASALVVTYGLVAVVLPLAALAYVSVSPFWISEIRVDDLTLTHYRAVFDSPVLVEAIGNSVRYALLAVVLVLPIGFVSAWTLTHPGDDRRLLKGALEAVVASPIMIPASLLGFGLLFTYSGRPLTLYGTPAILILAYVILMVPHATRLQQATLVTLGRDYYDAGRASGAGPLRTAGSVMFPLLRRSVAASCAVMIVLLTHEFSASLMVRSLDTQVMGSVLYDVYAGGIYPQVAVLALVMTAITTAGVALALALGGSDALGS